MKRFLLITILILTACASMQAATFDFTGTTGIFSGSGCSSTENGSSCGFGDQFNSTVSGIHVTITAFSILTSGGNFAGAQVFKSGAPAPYFGLGVCNSVEGPHVGDDNNVSSNCQNEEGFVDNIGQRDFLLFTFDQLVDPTGLVIAGSPQGSDIDAQFWYSVASLGTSLSGNLATGSLNGLPGGTQNNTPGTGDVTVNFSGAQAVRSVIFSVDASGSDGVKVKSLSVDAVPEPSSMALLGSGLIGLVLMARRRK